MTLIEIGSESPMLKGYALKASTGMVQLLEDMTEDSLSALQFAKSFSKVPVEVLISTMYDKIDKPPWSGGKVQLTPISCSVFTVVVGASGCEGTVAAMIVKTSEYGL